jgi:hypothetical protein
MLGFLPLKLECQGDPAHRKRVLREMSTQKMKILNIWSLPCKKVSKSKWISSKWMPQ